MEKSRIACGLEYTHEIAYEDLEKFRDGVESLMLKYKVFYVTYSLNYFKNKKKK